MHTFNLAIVLILIPTISFSMEENHTPALIKQKLEQQIKEEFDIKEWESNFDKELQKQQESKNNLRNELTAIDIKNPQAAKKLQDIKKRFLTDKSS